MLNPNKNDEYKESCPFRLKARACSFSARSGCFCNPGLYRLEIISREWQHRALLKIYKDRLKRGELINGQPYLKMGCSTNDFCTKIREINISMHNFFDQET